MRSIYSIFGSSKRLIFWLAVSKAVAACNKVCVLLNVCLINRAVEGVLALFSKPFYEICDVRFRYSRLSLSQSV